MVILSDINDEGNNICINSWDENFGNEGNFKAKKKYFKNANYSCYLFLWKWFNRKWKKCLDLIRRRYKKYINAKAFTRCPIYKRIAEINSFEIVERCKLKCLYKKMSALVCSEENKNFPIFGSKNASSLKVVW